MASPTAIEIRVEQPSDFARIYHITESAFRDRPYADGDEQDVIQRLRATSALSLSLVAMLQGDLVGHIAFSPAATSDPSVGWFALGPVSVLPEYQGRGIGSVLINTGLDNIKAQGALGCMLTGNPSYYRRFGFAPAPKNVPAEEAAEFFMLKCFTQQRPIGPMQFHPAFYGEV